MARGIYGDGSLFFDNGKRLWVQTIHYTLANGEHVTKKISAKTKLKLRDKVRDFNAKLALDNIQAKNITVRTWLQRWLDVYVKTSCKQKTYENYRDRVRYVYPYIGDRQLHTITVLELQHIFNDLLLHGGAKQQGLSSETIRCMRRYLKAAFDIAIQNGYLSKNPVSGTKPPKKEPSKIVVINEEQVAKLLEVAKAGEYVTYGVQNPKYIKHNIGTRYLKMCYYNFVNLALASGMRCGELRGLRWSCVDFEHQKIKIKMQIVTTADYADIHDEQKTFKSRRVIYIDADVMSTLHRYMVYQSQYAKLVGDKFINTDNLVFTNTVGNPVSVSNFRKRYYHKMLGTAGVSKDYTIHSMRHTHATLLLKHGVNLNVVSQRLGHSSPSVTLNIYAHVLDDMETTAAEAWSKIAKVSKVKKI